MAFDLKTTLNNNRNSGLFIDEQLACPSLCWEVYCQSNTSEGSPYDKLLLRGVISDETPTIKFDVRHAYSNDNLINEYSSKLSQAFSLQKQYQVAGSALIDTAKGMVDGIAGALGNDSKVGNMLGNTSDWLSDTYKAGQKAVNKASSEFLSNTFGVHGTNIENLSRGSLMLGTSSIKFYEGTEVAIEIPKIEFRYYHNMYADITVKQLIESLNEKFIGKFTGTGDASGSSVGIMEAPNGYFASDMDVLNLTTPKAGTFMIRYAGREIPNLICDNYSVDFSTTKVMSYGDYSGESTDLSNNKSVDFGGSAFGPSGDVSSQNYLYADISLSFTPIAVMTKETINDLMNINAQ